MVILTFWGMSHLGRIQPGTNDFQELVKKVSTQNIPNHYSPPSPTDTLHTKHTGSLNCFQNRAPVHYCCSGKTPQQTLLRNERQQPVVHALLLKRKTSLLYLETFKHMQSTLYPPPGQHSSLHKCTTFLPNGQTCDLDCDRFPCFQRATAARGINTSRNSWKYSARSAPNSLQLARPESCTFRSQSHEHQVIAFGPARAC
ncbi:unnamed protein product, partial [Ectocarpus sp. 4 AP-2014]